MKKIIVYGIVFLSLLTLPFWIMACRLIAPYGPAPSPPELSYYATAEIYRTITGSSHELSEKWSSWLYIPTPVNAEVAQEYAVDKINQYISESLAPGFSWHYRNLVVTLGQNISTTRSLTGADCDNKPLPRIYGGPSDNRIIFDTVDVNYRNVEIYTYDANNAIVDQVTVPISYAELAFAARPGMVVNDPWLVINDDHLLFPDIYFELEDFQITVKVDGELHTTTISNCSVKNIGTVTAEYLPVNGSYRIIDGKFYLDWHESLSGDTLQFCVNSSSGQDGGGSASWCGTYDSFNLGLSLNQSQLGMPILFNVHLALPAGSGNSFVSHQPKVQLVDKVVYATHLPVSVPLDIFDLCDVEDGVNFAKFYWIEDYQDPSGERLIAGLVPPLSPIQQSYTSYGQHKITAIIYDTDGGYGTSTMTLEIRQPGMTVLSPNGDECVEVSSAAGGMEREITWFCEGLSGDVAITLIYDEDGQEHQKTIVDHTPNDGSFTWTLEPETRNQCRIRICDAATGTICDESDDPFAIVAADSCIAGATPITLGHHQGTLRCATNDGGIFCNGTADQPDVWYQYTAHCSGELRVDTCGTNDSCGEDQGMDTIVSLHTRCPQLPVPGVDVCNDDWPVRDNPPYFCPVDQGKIRDSFVSMPMQAGETVLIRVSRYESSRCQNYFLNLSFYPPICLFDTNCDGDVDGADLAYYIPFFQFGVEVDLQGLAADFGISDPAQCQEIE